MCVFSSLGKLNCYLFWEEIVIEKQESGIS